MERQCILEKTCENRAFTDREQGRDHGKIKALSPKGG
jgi:hypothetical protein